MLSHKALWHKAWVETRSRFWIGAVILLCSAMMVVFAWPRASDLLTSAAKVELNGDLGRQIRQALQLTSEYRGYAWDQWFAKNLTYMGTLFAALLGAGGLLSAGSGGLFLLSLPASRDRLLLTRAATGLIELFVLVVGSSLVIPALSPAVGKQFSVPDTLVHSLCLFAATSVFFSLAFLLSTEFGDTWRPLLLALGVAMLIALVERAVGDSGLFTVMSGGSYFRSGQVPWLGLVATVSVSAGLLAASILNIARRDF